VLTESEGRLRTIMQSNSFLGLENKHILLTGASGGIGLSTALLFLQNGAKVTLHYNTQQKPLEEIISKYPNHTFAVQASATNEEQIANAYKLSIDKFGPIDCVVINHGIWPPKDIPVKDMTLEHWNNTINVNLTGSFLFAREFLRSLEKHARKTGNIILIASTAGIFGEANHCDYASSKSGMMYGFMRSLKNEIIRIAPLGRVNTVAPGWVATAMAEDALKDKALVSKVLQTIPLKKVALPDDVASAILFLSSDKTAGHLSGEIIEVTGGMEGRVLHPPSY